MTDVDYLIPLWALLIGWISAGGSPGPATLTISGTAMAQGRRAGLIVALGVLAGSASWGIAAALGFSAIMIANAWLFEVVRYAGALYLLYLAAKSLRSAWKGGEAKPIKPSKGGLFVKGLLLHLTNPKAILSWGSVYAIALPEGAAMGAVWQLFLTLFAGSLLIFLGYAVLFSIPAVSRAYARSRRWFELAFGVMFGAASLKILTVKLT